MIISRQPVSHHQVRLQSKKLYQDEYVCHAELTAKDMQRKWHQHDVYIEEVGQIHHASGCCMIILHSVTHAQAASTLCMQTSSSFTEEVVQTPPVTVCCTMNLQSVVHAQAASMSCMQTCSRANLLQELDSL